MFGGVGTVILGVAAIAWSFWFPHWLIRRRERMVATEAPRAAVALWDNMIETSLIRWIPIGARVAGALIVLVGVGELLK